MGIILNDREEYEFKKKTKKIHISGHISAWLCVFGKIRVEYAIILNININFKNRKRKNETGKKKKMR